MFPNTRSVVLRDIIEQNTNWDFSVSKIILRERQSPK